MASIRSLKKKIHQQTFRLLLNALIQEDSSNPNIEKLHQLADEMNAVGEKCLERINASRGWKKAERRAELISVRELLNDKIASLK